MIKKNELGWKSIVCIGFVGFFLYKIYFVDITPIEKLGSTMSGYFWILLASIVYIMDKVTLLNSKN